MPDDARLLELTWLTEMERDGSKTAGPFPDDSPERRLAVYLVVHGYANDESQMPVPEEEGRMGKVSSMFEGVLRPLVWQLRRGGKPTELRLSHRGAVRRAELEQQLKSGRIKEPMGLVWDGRHFRQDARIALLDASAERPLAVAYLDLNDVKAFNAVSHDTGDAAIRAYLSTIADLAYDRGDAYRLSGGADEVIVLLPKLQLDPALAFVRKLLAALGGVQVAGIRLRAAVGLVVATDTGETVDALKTRADAEQLRAKAASKNHDGRPSVLAWSPDHLEVQALSASP